MRKQDYLSRCVHVGNTSFDRICAFSCCLWLVVNMKMLIMLQYMKSQFIKRVMRCVFGGLGQCEDRDLKHFIVFMQCFLRIHWLTPCLSSQGRSLNVKASPSSSPSSTSLVLSPGNSLTLMCGVTADNLPALSLEVSWLADGREIITMDRSGVVISNTSSSGAQGKKGEASLERTETGDYRLGVRGVTIENGGNYTCRIRAFINKEGRRWYMTAEKTSNPVTVKVSEIRECFPQCSSSLLPHYVSSRIMFQMNELSLKDQISNEKKTLNNLFRVVLLWFPLLLHCRNVCACP